MIKYSVKNLTDKFLCNRNPNPGELNLNKYEFRTILPYKDFPLFFQTQEEAISAFEEYTRMNGDTPFIEIVSIYIREE